MAAFIRIVHSHVPPFDFPMFICSPAALIFNVAVCYVARCDVESAVLLTVSISPLSFVDARHTELVHSEAVHHSIC